MNKDVSISIIRLIALLMIISCHIFQGLNMQAAFWFNLGVQIFFFVSGFLYAQKEIKEPKKWLLSQVKKIMIPYVILLGIVLILEQIFLDANHSLYQISAGFLGFQAFVGPINILSHTWFVSYILIAYLITPFILQKVNIEKFKDKKVYLFFIVIFILLLEFYQLINIRMFWIINYILGYYFAKYFIVGKRDYTKFMFGFISIGLLLFIPRLIAHYYSANNHIVNLFIERNEYLQQLHHVILGSSLFMILYKCLKKFNLKNNFILLFSDKYSYHMYLTHQIFILYGFSVLKLTDYLPLNILLILTLTISSAIILHFISNHILKLINKIEIKGIN